MEALGILSLWHRQRELARQVDKEYKGSAPLDTHSVYEGTLRTTHVGAWLWSDPFLLRLACYSSQEERQWTQYTFQRMLLKLDCDHHVALSWHTTAVHFHSALVHPFEQVESMGAS
ncbi:unnamed protein product [Urochloa humidicola]